MSETKKRGRFVELTELTTLNPKLAARVFKALADNNARKDKPKDKADDDAD